MPCYLEPFGGVLARVGSGDTWVMYDPDGTSSVTETDRNYSTIELASVGGLVLRLPTSEAERRADERGVERDRDLDRGADGAPVAAP